MSVIAAVVSAQVATMAADSRQSWGSSYVDGVPKIFRCGVALVGMAGGAVYRRALTETPPLMATATSGDTTIWCATVIDRARAWAKKQGHGEQRGEFNDLIIELLVATPRGLWQLSGEGSITRIPRHWHAIGSGGPEALGSLFTSAGVSASRKRVRDACAAAIALDSGCGGEISVNQSPS